MRAVHSSGDVSTSLADARYSSEDEASAASRRGMLSLSVHWADDTPEVLVARADEQFAPELVLEEPREIGR
jgi:hypothetical protein